MNILCILACVLGILSPTAAGRNNNNNNTVLKNALYISLNAFT